MNAYRGIRVGLFVFLAVFTISFLSSCDKSLDTAILDSIPNDLNPNPVPTPTPSSSPPPFNIDGPTVTPEQPAGVISATVQIGANATGPSIALVEFFVNGNSIGTDSTAPYSVPFDTHTVPGPTVLIKAKAFAGSGEQKSTPELSFTIDNLGPSINSFTVQSGNPQDPPGTISGNAVLSVIASDNTGIGHVDFYLDGTTLIGSVTQPTSGAYVLNWDTSQVPNGPYALTAKVFDATAGGNPTTSAPINVSISNGGAVISITAPQHGQPVSGVITVSATASDPSGVTSLLFITPPGLIDTDPAPNIFQATFDTTGSPEGPLTFTAKAVNGLGELSFSSVTPTIDNIPFDGAISIMPPLFTGGDFGAAVAMVGDTNQDGYDDVVLGSPNADFININSGLAIVFLGPDFMNNLVIANPEPAFNALFGFSVTGLGDIDGDGNADLAVSAPGASVNGQAFAGKVYLFKGPNFSAASAVTLINPSTQGGEQFGYAISGGGDVNGDGSQDMLITAPRFTDTGTFDTRVGRAYLVKGPNFSNFTLIPNPVYQFDARFGESVAILGDSNADGKADFVVGTPNYNLNSTTLQNCGRIYIYRGTNTLFATVDDPTPQSNGNFGSSVAAAGDLNGDAKADLLVGVAGANSAKGEAFYALAPNFNLSASLTMPGGQANDQFGSSATGAGDVNGDGNIDFAFGAPNADKTVVFLGPNFTTKLILTHPSGASGINFGGSISGGGDVNGDGLGDLVVGAGGLPPNGGGSVHFNN